VRTIQKIEILVVDCSIQSETNPAATRAAMVKTWPAAMRFSGVKLKQRASHRQHHKLEPDNSEEMSGAAKGVDGLFKERNERNVDETVQDGRLAGRESE